MEEEFKITEEEKLRMEKKVEEIEKKVLKETYMKIYEKLKNFFKLNSETPYWKIKRKERNILIERFYKEVMLEEFFPKKINALEEKRGWEKWEKSLKKWGKGFYEEHFRSETAITEEREKIGGSIRSLAKEICISIGQFEMGIYKDYIYENILLAVEQLRNDVKSLAKIDLPLSEYENLFSLKGFNLEDFLSNIPLASEKYPFSFPYDGESSCRSPGSDVDCLRELGLGMGWFSMPSREGYNYKCSTKNKKEDYLIGLELVNRIEKRVIEVIKDYTPGVSKKIIEIKLPPKPKIITLKCVDCGWETVEKVKICEECGGKLKF